MKINNVIYYQTMQDSFQDNGECLQDLLGKLNFLTVEVY